MPSKRVRRDHTYIYGLVDPRSGRVRYVGKTDYPNERQRNHRSDKRNSHKTNWIRSLIRLGLRPVMVILETVSRKDWQQSEQFQIAFFRERESDLTNLTNGGEIGKTVSDETRLLQREIKIGGVLPDEQKDKIRHAVKAHVRSGKHNTTKLAPDDVREIRRLHEQGLATRPGLARMFGVTRTNIGYILHRDTWSDVLE